MTELEGVLKTLRGAGLGVLANDVERLFTEANREHVRSAALDCLNCGLTKYGPLRPTFRVCSKKPDNDSWDVELETTSSELAVNRLFSLRATEPSEGVQYVCEVRYATDWTEIEVG